MRGQVSSGAQQRGQGAPRSGCGGPALSPAGPGGGRAVPGMQGLFQPGPRSHSLSPRLPLQPASLQHGVALTHSTVTREDTATLPALPLVPRQAAPSWHTPASQEPAAARASCKLPALPAAPSASAQGKETAFSATARIHRQPVPAAQGVPGAAVRVESGSRAALDSGTAYDRAAKGTSRCPVGEACPGCRQRCQQQGQAGGTVVGAGTSSPAQSWVVYGRKAPIAPSMPRPPRRGGTGRDRAAASLHRDMGPGRWGRVAEQDLARPVPPVKCSLNGGSPRVGHQPSSTITTEPLGKVGTRRWCHCRHRLVPQKILPLQQHQEGPEQSGLQQQGGKEQRWSGQLSGRPRQVSAMMGGHGEEHLSACGSCCSPVTSCSPVPASTAGRSLAGDCRWEPGTTSPCPSRAPR